MVLLNDFKKECIAYQSDIIVQKHLIEGESFFFREILNQSEFDFKKDISTILNAHLREVVIVGSGKLGFSIKPEKGTGLYMFKDFDFNYNRDNKNEKSDLDIAIISSELFDREFKNLYYHTSYYSESFLSIWKDRNALAKYVLKGRLATRFFPSDFRLSKELKDVQSKYQKLYGRIINFEIYKSWFYFETYHEENIKNIQINLISH
ncbi:hypothetical protein [Chryseobacterium sp. 2987]|uniref:hypothetical protein n=1 Tax=Chryseobacterium sp. 2987 TaxID=2817767 RepID=UPI00286009E6|nr:hypothetical protein [Chryseobacterium sp. 2987]MDR6919589.1 hypothetical protein [Chryseobacterium sp. 2987]